MSEAQSFDWVSVDDGRTDHITEEPAVMIYRDGSGRINAAADYRWFHDFDGFKRHVDIEQSVLGFRPVDGDDVCSISREYDFGGTISLQGAMTVLDLDPAALEETFTVELEKHGDMIIADLSDFPERPVDHESVTDHNATAETIVDEASGGYDAADEPVSDDPRHEVDDEDQIWCGICGTGPLDSQKELNGHHAGSKHDGDTVPLDHEPSEEELRDGGTDEPADHGEAEVPDADDVPSAETVRDCADSVDTVQELGDLLEVSTGEARFLARDADVYGDLNDDVAPMGAGNR